MKEWCGARLEKVRGEIETKQQKDISDMGIERYGSLKARWNISEGGEKGGIKKDMSTTKFISSVYQKYILEEGMEKEIRIRKSKRNSNF